MLTATGGALGLVVDQPTGAIVRLATAAGLPSLTPGDALPADERLIGRILREQGPPTHAAAGELAGQAALGVALWWDDAPRGVLMVAAAPGRHFTTADRAAMSTSAATPSG